MTIEEMYSKAVETPVDAGSDKFEVTDLKSAEWCAKMIALRRARIDELQAFAKAKIADINSWLDNETRLLQNDIDSFSAMLRPYGEAEVIRLKGKKSIPLSNGTKLMFKKAQPKFEYVDADVISWLNENGYADYVVSVPKLKWGDFKSACVITDEGMVTPEGELVPCVTVIPAGEDTFFVDTKGVKNNA